MSASVVWSLVSMGNILIKPFPNMLMKVMIVAYVDVLCMWMESWKSGKLKCTRIVFKDLAIHVGLCIDNFKFRRPHFLEEVNEMNGIT